MLDSKQRVKDKAQSVKEQVKDMPIQAGYAVHSVKERAKENVSDFKRGMVEEKPPVSKDGRQNRTATGRP